MLPKRGLAFEHGKLSSPYVPNTTEVQMSQRHRSTEMAPPPPKADQRARAHNERHRIHSELQSVATQVSAGSPPEDVHEPGRAWVPERHDGERTRAPEQKALRHWKLKMWKRRSAGRRARAVAIRGIAEHA